MLIPCYNAASYAEKFIQHVALLNKPFDEIIFYDDASTDNTMQLLTAAGFRIIHGVTNKGPGYARNYLAEKATGDYIHFHDIDDEFNPLFLSLIDEGLNISRADVIVGQADWIDEITRDTVIKWRYNEADMKKDPLGYFIANPLGIINAVYKRESFLKVYGFSENIRCWEDADLHVRLAASGARFSVIDKVLAFSIRHNNGISKDQKWCWKCRLKFLEEYKAKLDAKYQYAIAIEFEKAANSLFYYNEFSKAITAFKHSRGSDYHSPSVNNPVLKKIRSVSPLAAFLLKGLFVKMRN